MSGLKGKVVFVVGGRGLTGSAVVRYLTQQNVQYEVIHREEQEAFCGKACDVLVYANGNALKYKANEDPYFDFHASLATVAGYVHRIKYKTFVHFSTIDVYPSPADPALTRDDIAVDSTELHPYGFHKWLAEEYVRRFCPQHLILRLPALVGPGLQKNPIFDYFSPHKNVMIAPESMLNVIHTDTLARIAMELVSAEDFAGGETYNLAAVDSLCLGDLADLCGLTSDYTENAAEFCQKYAINTDRLQAKVDLPRSRDEVLRYLASLQLSTDSSEDQPHIHNR